MHIQIRHIQAFLAVARDLHFGKAALRLNIAQPALSRTIQHLESMLGVPLLERTTRNVQLTEAGRSFCEHGTRVLQELDKAIHCAQRSGDGSNGRLAVGYVDFALAGPMPQIFGEYKRAFPNVEIDFLSDSPEKLLALLSEKRIDCGFVVGPVRNINLDSRCIQTDPPVVVMPVAHRLALRSKIRPADLASERFVLLARDGWKPFYRRLEKVTLKAGFVPLIGQEVAHTDALLAMVAAEIGIAICPASIGNAKLSGVVAVPLIDTELVFDVHFAWYKENTSAILANLSDIVSRFGRGVGAVEPARAGELTRVGDMWHEFVRCYSAQKVRPASSSTYEYSVPRDLPQVR
jgi:DNA-binding transcriptional LysR family regulator